MRIIFMGTPIFAVGVLEKLIDEKLNIVAVITAPDKPAGRGQKISQSAVKEYSLYKNIPIIQPSNLKDESFINKLSSYNADLFVVVAFRMLPEQVWKMPKKGTINLHASILPQYRGAAPINWAIINGENETGVTVFFIEKEIDSGDIIAVKKTNIDKNENAEQLHDKLLNIGKNLIYESILKIAKGGITPIKQSKLIDVSFLKPAPKLTKENTKIDWAKTSLEIHNLCRGLSPYPNAWTTIKNKENGQIKNFKIYKTEISEIKCNNKIIENKNELLVPCKDYYIKILECQLEGKKRMLIKEFLAGFSFKLWDFV